MEGKLEYLTFEHIYEFPGVFYEVAKAAPANKFTLYHTEC